MKRLLVLICVLAPLLSFAQTEADLLSKYWKYRQRLLGDPGQFNREPGFLRVGAAPGNSIVAMNRNRFVNNYNLDIIDPNSGYGQCILPNVADTPPFRKGWIAFSDGTIVHGYYLAVLASEWKLLNDTGANVTDTEDELYYAIQALERIDNSAETYYGSSPSLNGFFVRDDVGPDMQDDFGTAFNLITSNGVCGPENDDPGITDWDGADPVPFGCNDICDGYKDVTLFNSMSQDQVVFLLLGLRLIKEFIPPNHYIYSMNVHDRINQITDRMITYIRDADSDGNNLWQIMDPIYNQPVGRGCCAKFFAHPIAIIGKDITGNTYPDNNEAGWILTKGSIGVQTEVNINMILPLAALSGNMTRNKLWDTSNQWEKEIWQLVYNILHENNMQKGIDQSFWENLLGTAPCSGPCYYPQDSLDAYPDIPCTPAPGWYHQNRWSSQEGKDVPPSNTYPAGWGEYNGLDYMLAYNLYRIAFDSGNNEPFGNYNRYSALGGIFPISIAAPPFCAVCDDFPFNIQVGGTVDITNLELNVLNPNSNAPIPANMSIKAGNQINIGSGFKVERGAYFHGWVLPWDEDCELGEDNLGEEEVVFRQINPTESSNVPSLPEPSINIYPVPSNGQITIAFKNWEPETVLDITINDILAREVFQMSRKIINNDQLDIDLSSQKPGAYFLTLKNEDYLITKQIIISQK